MAKKIFKPVKVKAPKMDATYKGLRKFSSFIRNKAKTLTTKSYKLPKMPKLKL